MIKVSKLVPQGSGLAAVLVKRAATAELDWDTRCKSRFDCTDSAGRRLGVFLARGSVVRGGDVLLAEDGSLIRVLAAAQPVMVARPPADPAALLRAAYHLGNRHVPVALHGDRLEFEPDPVLAQMLERLHLTVTEANAPFEPEGGAYAPGGDVSEHGHPHAHEYGGHGHAGHRRDDPAHHDHGHDHHHHHVGHGHDHGHHDHAGHHPHEP
jgi:urease accessory protein